ncbi:kinesin-like protein KIF21A [Mizuhopecten yessoensis]|uniref:kinesin-like protein KIF21A n=1 Tax=Mizuhopecten yessoensis TaxID=6573 RepID=UPI000B45C04C|nr:kinesin-like protein KIF21A [Mizuhopecten yessoensis]
MMTEKNEEQKEQMEDQSSVRVALRIRPQLARERIDMCQVCTTVLPGGQQVMLGKDKAFTFDYTFDIPTFQHEIYDKCVFKLIEGCFDGYNATVFAYGQTGSGKTYTMGTGFDVNQNDEEVGIVPRAVSHLFRGIQERQQQAKETNEPQPDFKVTVQFIELYNEEIFDLLDITRDPESRGKKSHVKIHEDATGGIYVVGVTTRPVISPQDTMQCLENGALSRSTASTNMNAQSSRSHAIFTITIKQHRVVKDECLDEDGKETDSTQDLNEFETLTAKFHFVDLAGSERLKRTGATGDRAKEGISINCGLLALGNVISALGDKTKKGSHVPYRDSKLTRLLQDSLGGNSRTLMIACISPSDRDFIETLNSLKYANRARNIKNKVIANQDKASKQLAALRSEITLLQQELIDYKTGKRAVDADGVESVNDMFHENSMLQHENEKLMLRIKALNEANETLKERNTQLLRERETLGILNIAEDARAGEVQKLIEGYLKETEELRGKLAESEAMLHSVKRRQMSSRMAMAPMSPIQQFSSMNLSGSMSIETPDPDNMITSILEEAKKDIKQLRKTRRAKSRHGHSSDKENISGDEKEQNESESKVGEEGEENKDDGEKEQGEEEEEDGEQNGEVLEEDDLEEELEDLDNSSEEEEEEESEDEDKVQLFLDYWLEWADSDNIHEDLAELTCEISIKQKLVEELEQSQRRLHSMKVQYEDKVLLLQNKIKATEQERDKVLSNINQVSTTNQDQVKKVKVEFEKKLSILTTDLKKMQAAKKDHAKLVKNQSHYEKQLKTLQHELGEMKKTKVRLMKQVKDEAGKSRQTELRRNKEVTQLRKEQLKKENIIRSLEKTNKHREVVLKRKQEELQEVESLRKKNVPNMSARTAGRVGRYERPVTIPIGPSSTRRRRRGDFSAKAAKQKWDAIEKNIGSVINKKQTIVYMERDMEVWLKYREKTCKKMEKYTKRRDAAIATSRDPADVKSLSDTVDTLNLQVQQAQENITECQTNIMQMEEAKEDGENLDITAIMSTANLDEGRYLLNHFMQMSLSKGMLLAQKEHEVRELQAQLHQTELNNTLQQDLLKHMINDRVDIEVDNLMTNGVDDMDTSTSSASSSPAESMFESQVPPQPAQLPPGMVLGDLGKRDKEFRRSLPLHACHRLRNRSKSTSSAQARRRTATPDELLYADGPMFDMKPPLRTLPETPEEEHADQSGKPLPEVFNGTESHTLMPPPRQLPIKVASSNIPRRSDPGPSPVFRRKEYTRPSPDPSPILRRKNNPVVLSRSSSLDTTSSDTTPPSSPTSTRRARITGDNVFSRLTSNTQPPSLNPPNRGSIVPNNGRIAAPSKFSPVTCTHTAEGHTKAILCVDATEDLLFSSSKDRTAKVWDLRTGREVLSLGGHPNNVIRVKYCEQQRLVFTVSQSFINVWDIRTSPSQCVKTLSSSGLTDDGPVNFASQRQVELPPGEHNITDIALNKDGTALYSSVGSVVRVWDLKSFSAVGKLNGGHQAAVMVLAVDKQGTNDMVITGSKDHYIKVFEVLEERAGIMVPKHNLEPPHYDGIQSLAVNGSTLFSGSRDMCIKKWDLTTNKHKLSLNSAHKDWVCALAFMPSSDILLSGCRSGFLKLWNVDTCQALGDIKAHFMPINSIATNSNSIFTASNEPVVKMWQYRRTQTLTTLWESGRLNRSQTRASPVLPPPPLKPWRTTSKYNKSLAPSGVKIYNSLKSSSSVKIDSLFATKMSAEQKNDTNRTSKIAIGTHRSSLHKML